MNGPNAQLPKAYPLNALGAEALLRSDAPHTDKWLDHADKANAFHVKPSDKSVDAFVETVGKLYGLSSMQVRDEVLTTSLGVHLLNKWQVGEVQFPAELPVHCDTPAWARAKIVTEHGNPDAGKAPIKQLDKRPDLKPPRVINSQLVDTPHGTHKSVAEAYRAVRGDALKQWGEPGMSARARNELGAAVRDLDEAFQGCNKKELARESHVLDVNAAPVKRLFLALDKLLDAVRYAAEKSRLGEGARKPKTDEEKAWEGGA